MDCPNQKCNTKNLPDDARFCPNCGTAILCELHMCIPYPATIKKGDTSELYFSGIGIESIEVAGVGKYYGKINDAFIVSINSNYSEVYPNDIYSDEISGMYFRYDRYHVYIIYNDKFNYEYL